MESKLITVIVQIQDTINQCVDIAEMTTLSKVISYEEMQKISAEFTRLKGRCYLENAGATLYPESLLKCTNEDLTNNVYMNPHSDKYTKDCIEQIRCLVLNHFNTDPSNYTLIFTSGTTQSLKLVVESFQFDCNENNCGSFVYLQDNHTSVLGLREIAKDKNADVVHISHEEFLESIENADRTHTLSIPQIQNEQKNKGNTLLVYPAQSNFNGFKYPINCINAIKDGCLNSYIKKHLCQLDCDWYVLLDAAAYVPTSRLDLSKTQPDYVCLSFYKIFGYPTGLGALLIKNSSANVLNQKRYFGGGTVDIVLSSEDFHMKRQLLHERLEDGTANFLAILALKHCFDCLHRLIPKVVNNNIMDTISCHTYYLAKDLYQQLRDLRHPNMTRAAVLYMDNKFDNIKKQGAIVAFGLLREDGSHIGYSEFQHMADLFNINVRTGCFCNSGTCQRHLVVSNKDMKDMFKVGHKCGDEIDLIQGRPTGAIRVSFTYYNTYNDVDNLILMICRCFVKTKFSRPLRSMHNGSPILYPNSNINIYNTDTIKNLNDPIYYSNVETPDSSQFESKIKLKEMNIYPIKSCGAFKVKNNWKIGQKGFEYDREWMIIKDNGVCLTQKQNSLMCMIKPVIDLKHRLLILKFEGKSPISVSLDVTYQNKHKDATFCQTKVCADIVDSIDCGDDVAYWISEALEVSFLRLVRQSNDRVLKNKNELETKLLSLSNQAQFLLVNRATVRWLKDKIEDSSFTDDLDRLTDRFRGNIIIDMEEELAERDWRRVIIGKHEFKVEGQCNRCQMVCIDQTTGEKTVEPLRTIAEQFGGKLRFGIYLTYVGPVDGSKDYILSNLSPIIPITNDDNISRFKKWFFMKMYNVYSIRKRV
ncbi:molybdenum cofactor sulfurase isoform X1 [Choristoneura fumiferana]|uniref:molybdenum cofactor sulfurase isoform X1 n=2 Tax=Choristoneura fumiferana TaxID=7141 RepID=UPI003D157F7F